MMTRTLLARCAPLAIAASVALPFIPAAAQDTVTAEPVIVLPDPAPVTVPTATPVPQIVLPETAVEPSAPVTATEPQPVEAAPVATRTSARQARTAPAPVAPAVERAVVASPAVPEARLAATVAEPTTQPVAAAPAAMEPTAADDNATGELALAGLLGVLGLGAVGGVAYAASRRRRRRALENERYDPVADQTVVDETIVEPTVAPEAVAARTIEPASDQVFDVPVPATSAFADPVVGAAATTTRTAPRANGDPIALPAEMPDTFEERDALLKELVAAEPDKANPFTGVRARARRAKLIMQSLNRDFMTRKPRIDLSEYTNRWPALRGWQPATA